MRNTSTIAQSVLAVTLAGAACLRAGGGSSLAQTPKPIPLETHITLSVQRGGGWGTGLLTEFTVSQDNSFTWRHRQNPASSEKSKWEELSGKVSRGELSGLLRQLELAGPGPQADDAGEVIFRWRGDPQAVEQRKSYSRPSAPPAADLLKMIEDLARRSSR